MDLDNKKIGARLDSIRTSENLTQEEMASNINISLSSYKNYVRGTRDVPASLVAVLLEKYSIDPLWFVAGEKTDYILNREFKSFNKIKEISNEVEDYLTSKQYSLDRDQKWRIVSQLYAQYVVQMAQQNSDLLITSGMIENSLGNVA